jgi:hypothetical protein
VRTEDRPTSWKRRKLSNLRLTLASQKKTITPMYISFVPVLVVLAIKNLITANKKLKSSPTPYGAHTAKSLALTTF